MGTTSKTYEYGTGAPSGARDNIPGMGLSTLERQRRYYERRMKEIATMPQIPCKCGCGEHIPPINKNLKPARYKHGHNPEGRATGFKKGNAAMARLGAKALWDVRGRGKPWKVKGGYYRVGIPVEEAAKYPTATIHKYGNAASITRSHLVWNRAHPNDPVVRGEQIHHLNLRRDDDRLENLHKMQTGAHVRLHAQLNPPRERDTNTGRFT